MKLFLRMIPMALRGLAGPRLHPSLPLRSRYRVWPHDLDVNLHLNNGRYLQLIDLNRLEWLMRTGILQVALRRGWRPILGATTTQFRRELRLFQCATIETRLMGWDERWFFLEHRVADSAGRPVALSLAKAAFRADGRWVSTEAMRAEVGSPTLPVLPEHAVAWLGMEEKLAQAIAMQPVGPVGGARAPAVTVDAAI